MAIPYSVPGYPPQAGFGAELTLVPTRPLVPMAPNAGMQAPAVYHPGISPVFDPHAFLPPVKPGEFDVQSLISIPDLIRYIRKRWFLGALAGLLLGIGVFYYLGMGMKIYQAESQILLSLKTDNPFGLDGVSNSIVSDLSAPMLVNNHRTEMTSRRFMEYFADHYPQTTVEVVAKRESETLGRKDQFLKLLGLYKPGKPAPARETFIEILSSNVAVEPLKESHVLRVQVRDRDPELAASLANRYVEFYIEYVGDNEAQLSEDASDYLRTQSTELLKRLQESEQKLAEYRRANGILEDVESNDVSGERVRQLNAALTEARVRLTRAENDSQALNAALSAGHSMLDVRLIAENPTVADTRKNLEAKQAARSALPQLGRRHPTIIALDNEIATLQAALDKAVKSVVYMIQEEVKTQQRQVADLQSQLGSAQGVAVDAGGKNVQLKMLNDEVRLNREMYEKVEQRRSAATLTGKFRGSGLLRIADRAVAPEKPVKPSKPLAAVAAAMLFGLSLIGLPIGWGLAEDHLPALLNSKSATQPHFEKEMAARASAMSYATQPLTRPVYALQPQAPSPVTGVLPSPFTATASQPLRQAPAPQLSPFTAAPAPQPVASSLLRPAEKDLTTIARLPYVHANSPESILAQLLKPEPIGASSTLHHLTGTLERQAASRGSSGGVILITSTEPREGKTLVASTLAAALCHQGRSVFMMECNPSSPTVHEWFPRTRGFEAWASDLEALRYSHTNLFLLPGRDLPAHATNELLDGYRTWIDRARSQVDWIILDASPLLKAFANVAPLAPLATDIIIVSHPALTAPAKIRAGIALLQPMMSSSALRGMVLNGV
ncbi:MAG: hypothetical protein RIS79_2045 [Verrucomicrobiota bacterium]